MYSDINAAGEIRKCVLVSWKTLFHYTRNFSDDELLLSIQIIHACQLMLLLMCNITMISSKARLKKVCVV